MNNEKLYVSMGKRKLFRIERASIFRTMYKRLHLKNRFRTQYSYLSHT